jgi:hypothetical protein
MTTSCIICTKDIILVSYLGACAQTSHAQEAVKTFRIKTQLDNSVVARGDTQTKVFCGGRNDWPTG